MENNFKFKELKNKIKLTDSERDFHRALLVESMNSEGSSILHVKAKTVSPFKFNFLIRTHLVPIVIVLVVFLGTGIAVSAEQSLPNDYLYSMRVKVIEPTKIMLASNVKKKTNLRIAFADRALKDYTKVSQKKEIKPSDKATLIKSFTENVKGANEGILALAASEDKPNSLEIANNLQSILSAHSMVLDKITTLKSELDKNTDTSNSDISTQISDGLNSTKEIVSNLTDTIQNQTDTTILDKTISDQKEEINTSIKDIADITKNGEEVKMENAVINNEPSPEKSVENKLAEINKIIDQANKKLTDGNKKEAFVLFNQADQKLGELKSILESEKNLDNGVDILSKNIDKNDKPLNTSETVEGSILNPATSETTNDDVKVIETKSKDNLI